MEILPTHENKQPLSDMFARDMDTGETSPVYRGEQTFTNDKFPGKEFVMRNNKPFELHSAEVSSSLEDDEKLPQDTTAASTPAYEHTAVAPVEDIVRYPRNSILSDEAAPKLNVFQGRSPSVEPFEQQTRLDGGIIGDIEEFPSEPNPESDDIYEDDVDDDRERRSRRLGVKVARIVLPPVTGMAIALTGMFGVYSTQTSRVTDGTVHPTFGQFVGDMIQGNDKEK